MSTCPVALTSTSVFERRSIGVSVIHQRVADVEPRVLAGRDVLVAAGVHEGADARELRVRLGDHEVLDADVAARALGNDVGHLGELAHDLPVRNGGRRRVPPPRSIRTRMRGDGDIGVV